MSELVKSMIANEQDGEEVQEISLPNVKSSVLSKVIEFCIHHHNKPMQENEEPFQSGDMHDVVSDWNALFIDVEPDLLFELILAANYMDIKKLLDLAKLQMRMMASNRLVWFVLADNKCQAYKKTKSDVDAVEIPSRS
ncbi:suppressor of kinetochore protein mutant [Aphanomyces cochlioides]|nr:suppressor of kinetochore protein mutant [Aphanomyces cochlioides]